MLGKKESVITLPQNAQGVLVWSSGEETLEKNTRVLVPNGYSAVAVRNGKMLLRINAGENAVGRSCDKSMLGERVRFVFYCTRIDAKMTFRVIDLRLRGGAYMTLFGSYHMEIIDPARLSCMQKDSCRGDAQSLNELTKPTVARVCAELFCTVSEKPTDTDLSVMIKKAEEELRLSRDLGDLGLRIYGLTMEITDFRAPGQAKVKNTVTWAGDGAPDGYGRVPDDQEDTEDAQTENRARYGSESEDRAARESADGCAVSRTSASGPDSAAKNEQGGQTIPELPGEDIYDLNIHAVGEVRTECGAASCFLIDDRGFFLTNTHAVTDQNGDACKTVAIRICGETVAASIVALGDDRGGNGNGLDVALLYTETLPEAAQAVAQGNSDNLRNGERVYYMGNSKGEGLAITSGIVSDRERMLNEKRYIMTDAATNPGNSGGPLIDRWGRVVGIHVSAHVDADGMKYAIPINDVRAFVLDIYAHYGIEAEEDTVGNEQNESMLTSIVTSVVSGVLTDTVKGSIKRLGDRARLAKAKKKKKV